MPFFRGFNAGLTFAGVHDSSIGWYTVDTPAISYVLSPRYSLDASLPVYPYRLVETESSGSNSGSTPVYALVAREGAPGDILLAFHVNFYPHRLQNTVTVSMTLPTGSRADGLGLGKVSFDGSEHMQRYIRRTGAVVDMGFGDSSGLFNRLVTNQNTGLAPVAHFQAGLIQWVYGSNYIESVAYEQLPVGDQKLYGIVQHHGMAPVTLVTGRRVSEDNGFNTAVGIPLTSHITLLGDYNRSLRLHLDTVSVGVTYSLRSTQRVRRLSLADKALREAEQGSQ